MLSGEATVGTGVAEAEKTPVGAVGGTVGGASGSVGGAEGGDDNSKLSKTADGKISGFSFFLKLHDTEN